MGIKYLGKVRYNDLLTMDLVEQMKKVLTITSFCIAAAAVAYISYTSFSDKPEYLQAAEMRVGSYLTSDVGRVSCNSTKVADQHWRLDCSTQAKGKTFEYSVYPAENAPYSVSRAFYLEAVNESAIQSAGQGLMKYLQINTATTNIQS